MANPVTPTKKDKTLLYCDKISNMTEKPGMLDQVRALLFKPNTKTKDDVVLGRLPKDIRDLIWEAPTSQIREVVANINNELQARGIAPIRGIEYKDAIEGNEFMQKISSISQINH